MATLGDGGNLWDDDGIVNDWKEALAEYRKYHSMAARGEMVKDIIDRVKAGTYGGAYDEHLKAAVKSVPADVLLHVVEQDREPGVIVREAAGAQDDTAMDAGAHTDSHGVALGASTEGAPGVDAPAQTSTDDLATSMACAQYWAGWYAGRMYERQQVAQRQAAENAAKEKT